MNTNTATVEEVCLSAFALGQTLDLSDCIYGPNARDRDGFLAEGLPYYRLLAGLAAAIDARTVVEIGTHFGGSTRALWQGMVHNCDPGMLLTVDIKDASDPSIRELAGVEVLIGDAQDRCVLTEIMVRLAGRTIDLLFLDGKKDKGFAETVLNHLLSRFAIRWVVIDDVNTRSTLPAFWQNARASWEVDAFEVSQTHPEMRDPRYGMGVIRVSPARVGRFLAASREKIGPNRGPARS
jgi:hypothetical protein